MHLTLWHIIHCPEKESEKKASKPNREGPRNGIREYSNISGDNLFA